MSIKIHVHVIDNSDNETWDGGMKSDADGDKKQLLLLLDRQQSWLSPQNSKYNYNIHYKLSVIILEKVAKLFNSISDIGSEFHSWMVHLIKFARPNWQVHWLVQSTCTALTPGNFTIQSSHLRFINICYKKIFLFDSVNQRGVAIGKMQAENHVMKKCTSKYKHVRPWATCEHKL